jgi:hypothetical protein
MVSKFRRRLPSPLTNRLLSTLVDFKALYASTLSSTTHDDAFTCETSSAQTPCRLREFSTSSSSSSQSSTEGEKDGTEKGVVAGESLVALDIADEINKTKQAQQGYTWTLHGHDQPTWHPVASPFDFKRTAPKTMALMFEAWHTSATLVKA